MNRLFVDATVPLRWGPRPAVGIAQKVEFAVIRQALHVTDADVNFFVVRRDGTARLIDSREKAYLADLVEGRLDSILDGSDRPFLERLGTVARAVVGGASASSKEFDRVAAGYLSRRADRHGLFYQAAKTSIRLLKLARFTRHGSRDRFDPLSDPGARCFLSSAGLHYLASGRRSRAVSANISTALYDLIPIEQPRLIDHGQARNFTRDIAWMFGNCRQIICLSNHTARQAQLHAERLGLERPPAIAVSQLGSLLKSAMCGRQAEPVPSLSGTRFAFYGSAIEIRKNHMLLLKLWASLIPEFGDRLPKLVFGGQGGWLYPEMKSYLASHPQLAGHVVILADVSDAQRAWLYRSASFGLYPSLGEDWELGAAESLDFGLPIIVSDAPSLGEATQGLMPVLPATDVEAWRAELRRALADAGWGDMLRLRIRMAYRPIEEGVFAARLLSLVQGDGGTLSRGVAVPVNRAGAPAPVRRNPRFSIVPTSNAA